MASDLAATVWELVQGIAGESEQVKIIQRRADDAAKPLDVLMYAMQGLAVIAPEFDDPTLMKQRDQALKLSEKAQRLFKDDNHKKGEGYALHAFGRVSVVRQRPQTALKSALAAIRIFQMIRDKRGEADATYTVVDALAQQAELAASGQGVRQSHHIKQTESGVKAELEAKRRSHLDEAVRQAEKITELFRALGEKKDEAAAFMVIANLRVALEEFEDAKGAAEEAVDLFREDEDRDGQVEALAQLLGIAIESGDGDEALGHAESVVRIFQQQKDKEGEMAAMETVVKVRFMRGELEETTKAAKEVMQYYLSKRDSQGQGRMLDVIMKAHLNAKNMDEAFKVAQDTVDMFAKNFDKDGEGMALNALAQLKFDKFFDGYEEMVNNFIKSGHNEDEWIEPDTKIYEEAQQHIQRANDLFKETGNTDGLDIVQETAQTMLRRAMEVDEPVEERIIMKDGRYVKTEIKWGKEEDGVVIYAEHKDLTPSPSKWQRREKHEDAEIIQVPKTTDAAAITAD